MTTNEHLAAADANLAPALRVVKRSAESGALANVIPAVCKLEARVDELEKQSAQAPAPTPLKRVPLGKAK